MNPTKHHYTHAVPPGKYIISDECYIYPHKNKEADDARQLTMDAIFGEEPNNGYIRSLSFLTKFGPLIINSTAYGDGSYWLKHKNRKIYSLPVDAGNISIIPFDYARQFNPKLTFSNNQPMTPDQYESSLGFFVEFTKEEVLVYKDGDFTVGGYSVKTND